MSNEDDNVRVLLFTGRTKDQGVGKEFGKTSSEYQDSVAVCEINRADMKSLGITQNDNVKVSTKFGSVTVKAKESSVRLHSGFVYIPYGPWANMIVDSVTNSTGMPPLKGIDAVIEATNERILEAIELIAE